MICRRIAGLLLLVSGMLPAQMLHLKTRDIDIALEPSDSGASLYQRNPNKSHYLLQFNGPVQRQTLEEIAKRGAVVTSFVPDSALMIAAGNDFTADGLDVKWMGRLRPEDKLSPALVPGPAIAVDGAAPDPSAVSFPTFVVEFHSDVDMDDAWQMMVENGLAVLTHPDLLPNQLLVSGTLDDLTRLQDWDETAYLLPASDDLANGNRVAACAGALSQVGPSAIGIANYVKVGHGWPADGPDGAQIKYVFGSLTNKVPPSFTKNEIVRAIQEWSKYARVQFVPGTDAGAPRTMSIFFAKGAHGDGFPFDGPGGTLAHTFYPAPPNPEPLAGDMHLDADENWHTGSNIDIYTVALHEAGHAIGLGHSDKPGNVMYPYYHLGAQLAPDDIAGAVDLYGAVAPQSNDTVLVTPVTPAAPVNPALILTVTNPAAASITTIQSSISISGISSAGAGNVQITWQTEHGAAGLATGSTSWTIGSVPLLTGRNTITITAIDSAHQTAVRTVQVTVEIPPVAPPSNGPGSNPAGANGHDTTPPALSITSPSGTIVSTGAASFSVRGTASDNVGVSKVTWQNSIYASGLAVGGANWIADNIPLYPGTNNLIIRAYDAAGNTSWRSVTVVRR